MRLNVDKTTIIQFVKFVFVGVVNAVIMLAVYYLFVWINSEWYLLGNVAGWIASVANAYLLNQKLTFKDKAQTQHDAVLRLVKSYLSYGMTFCLSTALLWLEVNVLSWSVLICPVLNILITTPLNFLLNKFWTFSK